VPADEGETDVVPDSALAPLHAPEAVQLVVLDEDQVMLAVVPRVIDVGETLIDAVGTGSGSVTVSVVVPVPDPCAFEQLRV